MRPAQASPGGLSGRRWRSGLVLLATLAVAASAAAQSPTPKKKGGLIKAVAKLADTTATAAAAGALDSLLGTKAAPCPAGTMPASGAAPATVGSEVVATAKKKLIGEPPDSSPAPVPGPTPPRPACVPAQTAAASAPAPAPPPAGTPAGTVATAVAAAPIAAKAVGGLFGRKGPDKAGMIRELARGRLILKAFRFLPGSDALEKPVDDEIGALAEALASMEAQFVLNMPAESRDGQPPDTVMARRRLERVIGYLQVAGVTQERVPLVGVFPPGLDPKARPPRPGDARPELVTAPKNPAPPR